MELPILDQILGNATFNVPTDIGSFVSSIVGAILLIAGIATFLFLVWGGLNWVMAGGDKGKVEEARTRITNALIGLAVVAASWAIFLLVDYFLGLNMAEGRGRGRNLDRSERREYAVTLCSEASSNRCLGLSEGDVCDPESGRTCQTRGTTSECVCR